MASPGGVSCRMRVTNHAIKRFNEWRKALDPLHAGIGAREEILHLLGHAVPCRMNGILSHRSVKWGFPAEFLHKPPWRFVFRADAPEEWVLLTVEPDIYPENMGPWISVPGVSLTGMFPAFTLGEIAHYNKVRRNNGHTGSSY